MTTTTGPNGIAPVDAGTYKLGAKGGRMAQAWQHVWDHLDRDTWRGGMELSRDAARKFDLKPVSVAEMLCRMRAAGVIEQELIKAETEYVRYGKPFVSQRKRVHYRIAKNWEKRVASLKEADAERAGVKVAAPSYWSRARVR